MTNLAGNADYQATLDILRKEVSSQIRNTKDLGFFPPNTRDKDALSLYDWARTTPFPFEEFYTLVEIASEGNIENISVLTTYLASDYPSIRFWAATGFTTIGYSGHKLTLPKELNALCDDSNPDVAAAAAEALCYHGQEEQGVNSLVALIQGQNMAACSALETYIKANGVTKAVHPHIETLKKLAAEKKKLNIGSIVFYIRSILVECGINTPWDLYNHDKWGPTK